MSDLRDLLLNENFKLESVNGNKDASKPKWLEPIFNKDNKYKSLKGGYKEVYIVGEHAITISTKKYFKQNLANALRRVDQRFQKYLIYPFDGCRIEATINDRKYLFFFSILNNCPGGDLFDLLHEKVVNKNDPSDQYYVKNKNYNRSDQDYIRLFVVLNELHQNGIYLGDIKPENIMLCRCDCLAFIDLDDAITAKDLERETLPKTKNYVGSFFYNPFFGKILDKSIGMLRYADVFALSLVYLEHLLLKRDINIKRFKNGIKDGWYESFYLSLQKTTDTGKEDFSFLDTPMQYVDKQMGIIINFLHKYRIKLKAFTHIQILATNTQWNEEANSFLKQLFGWYMEYKRMKEKPLRIRTPSIKF